MSVKYDSLVKWSGYLISTLAFCFLVGCDAENLCSESTNKTLESPSGESKAVVVKRDCGATTSEVYLVYIFNADEQPAEKNAVFKSDKTEALSISWQDDRNLIISYKSARIFNFTNFWQSTSKSQNKEVHIREILIDWTQKGGRFIFPTLKSADS